MGEFVKILLSLSFSGTFLFLIVFLVVQMYRNRLSRRCQYYIWLLVVFRFLIPFTFPHTVTGYLFRGVEQAVTDAAEKTEQEAVLESAADMPDDVPESTAGGADAAAGITDGPQKKVDGQRAASGTSTASDVVTVSFQGRNDDRGMSVFSLCVFGIWAAGALGLLIRKITVYQSYMQFLRKGNAEVSDLGTLNLLAAAEEQLGMKRTIELYRNSLIASPIMTGFFRPKIVIPDKKMTDGELACIFAHELVHFKYFDMFYKWLVQITICIHWFNPFAWLLGKEVNKRCELSCDEKVIGALDEQERKNYGDTLLSFLKRGETYQNPLASITMTEGAEQLIERLGAIMDYQKKSKKIVILTTVLTVLLCFFFSGIGAYAGAYAGQQDAADKSSPVQKNAAEKGSPVQKDAEAAGNGALSEAEDVSDKQEEQQNIDYDLLYDEENHVYYILIEGATIDDRPVGGVVGGIGIMLVRKSGYTVFQFSSFSVKFGFMDEVESQCEDALEKGRISAAEAELVLEVAAAIEEGTVPEAETVPKTETVPKAETPKNVSQTVGEWKEKNYSYYQQSFYKEPYLIEFGWNMREEWTEYYTDTEIILNDRSRMSVYFSKEAETWMKDAAAMEAVSRLAGELEADARGDYGIEMKVPFVSQITYLPLEEVKNYAKQAFENDELADFAAVACMLPEEVKEEYCEKSYAKDDIGFFSVIISETNADYIKAFAERCYERDETDYFAVAADDLTEKDRKDLMEKALQEEKDAYYYILKDKE